MSNKLHHDYNYLSNLFSELEVTTIEKYFIAEKIEKVKELLVYDELTLSQIAFCLKYSSVAYLSNQFKKVTELSPCHCIASIKPHLDEANKVFHWKVDTDSKDKVLTITSDDVTEQEVIDIVEQAGFKIELTNS